jgi:enoyl-CoA hydratase/carnithine racemase
MPPVSVKAVRAHGKVVTLDSPSRLNSMSFALVSDLCAALEEVAADNECTQLLPGPNGNSNKASSAFREKRPPICTE